MSQSIFFLCSKACLGPHPTQSRSRSLRWLPTVWSTLPLWISWWRDGLQVSEEPGAWDAFSSWSESIGSPLYLAWGSRQTQPSFSLHLPSLPLPHFCAEWNYVLLLQLLLLPPPLSLTLLEIRKLKHCHWCSPFIQRALKPEEQSKSRYRRTQILWER